MGVFEAMMGECCGGMCETGARCLSAKKDEHEGSTLMPNTEHVRESHKVPTYQPWREDRD